jgi:hypothetical protein
MRLSDEIYQDTGADKDHLSSATPHPCSISASIVQYPPSEKNGVSQHERQKQKQKQKLKLLYRRKHDGKTSTWSLLGARGIQLPRIKAL